MAISRLPAVPEHNNFTVLRYVLAFMVVLSHLGELSQAVAFLPFYQFISSQFAIHGFFVISGFLIYRSYLRNPDWKQYLKKRLRRIFPAYLAVVLIAAVGLFFFSSAQSSYFSSAAFWKYLLANSTTLNFLQPSLPGVFEHQYTSAVNGALWTIKVELAFYIFLPVLLFFMFNVEEHRRVWILLLLYVFSIMYSETMLYLYNSSGKELFNTLLRQLPGKLCYFVSGMLLFKYLDYFRKYAHAALIGSIALLFISIYVKMVWLNPFIVAVLVGYAALILPAWFSALDKHDYSYGIYLWHFPLIQCFVALHLFDENPWSMFLLLIAMIVAVAALSWYGLELKFIRKK